MTAFPWLPGNSADFDRVPMKACGSFHRSRRSVACRGSRITIMPEHVDFILTDVADADRLSKQALATASAPSVLPVMYEPTKEESKQVEARYHCQLKSSDRVDRYLSAIDDAMKARVAQRKRIS